MKILEELKFDEKGLIPAIIQDADTGEVLMVAYMNKAALAKTMQSGMTHFWSRSRQKMWLKGEASGHIQKVKDIFVDCDQDALLIKVDQKGGACHAGYRSCFYRKVIDKGEDTEIIAERVFDPGRVYARKE